MKIKLHQKDAQALVAWFQKNQRAFPWRLQPQPYFIWLAEVMSQQTQMATLIPYFNRFIEKFPTVEALAKASQDAVLLQWTGLGYYSRARNLHKAAQNIVEKFGTDFPHTYLEWLELPGIGPYTAAAIVSQAFNCKEPVWDGNVLRVSSRYFGEEAPYAATFKDAVLNGLRENLETVSASAFNQALMELGATVCTRQNPACTQCPLQKNCRAFTLGKTTSLPPAKPRKAVIEVKPRVLVRIRQSLDGYEALLLQRPSGSWFQGMWDFDTELGGVGEPVRKNSRVDAVRDFQALGKVKHSITHHKVELQGLLILENKKKPEAIPEGARWLSLNEIVSRDSSVPVATTARKVMRLVGKALEHIKA